MALTCGIRVQGATQKKLPIPKICPIQETYNDMRNLPGIVFQANTPSK